MLALVAVPSVLPRGANPMQTLLPLPAATERQPWPSSANRTIWMFWAQGEANLSAKRLERPADVTAAAYGSSSFGKYRTAHRCLHAWRRLNPEWTVRLLDDSEAASMSPLYALLKERGVGKTQLWSDVLRLDLLARYGGVWVDATLCERGPSRSPIILVSF